MAKTDGPVARTKAGRNPENKKKKVIDEETT